MSGTTSGVALPYPPDDPELVAAAADRCARLAVVAAAVADELARDAGRLAAAWSGPAAVGCRAELGAATRVVGSLAEPLHRSAAELRAHGRGAARRRGPRSTGCARPTTSGSRRTGGTSRRCCRTARGPGRSGGCRPPTCWPRSSSSSRRCTAATRTCWTGWPSTRAATARRIGAAAGSVGPVPGGGAPVADREAGLAALLPLLAASRRAAGVGPGARRLPGTPAELVRQWWAALTSDERDRAVATWPAELGALDGLPAAVRSTANERRLDRDVAALATAAAA